MKAPQLQPCPAPGLSREASKPPASEWRPPLFELLGWCALAWIVATCFLAYTHGLSFTNDGYQYLSVAENIRHGHGAATSIVYFDAERSYGRIPAPMTTFPPLYSALVAAASMTGLRPEIAAILISQISFVLLPLAFGLAIRHGIRPWAFRTTAALLITNTLLLSAANRIASDALFTFVVAAAITCFSRAAADDESKWLGWQAFGWLLIGCSYWIRYAGLFALTGLLGFFLFGVCRRRDRKSMLLALTSVLAIVPIGANAVRNAALRGSWRGGVSKQALDGLHFSVKPSVAALYHLTVGESRVEPCIGLALFFLAVAGLVILAIRERRQTKMAGPQVWMLAALVCVYYAAMVYADMTMVISFGTRYFIPLLPPLFLLLALRLSALERTCRNRAAYFALSAVLVTGYAAMHYRGADVYTPSLPHEQVLSAMQQGDLTSWVPSHIPRGAVITATDGQATAYALQHPILCVADPPFSDQMNSREQILAEMARFRSEYLIVYPGLSDVWSPIQQASPFIRGLLQGDIPEGFKLEARNSTAMIFRRTVSPPRSQ